MSFLHTGVENRSAEDDRREAESSLVREVSEKMVCSACKYPFINREEQVTTQYSTICSCIENRCLNMHFVLQREHYKLDWHRFNLRQKMAMLPPLTAEEFERKTGAGEETGVIHI